MDASAEAIGIAWKHPGVKFLVADMTEPLPFADASFDAVMANVSLHMFPDAVTRAVFAEIERVVRPGGLLLFHVNATSDRPLRAMRIPVERELEPDYVLERSSRRACGSSRAPISRTCSPAGPIWTRPSSRFRTGAPGYRSNTSGASARAARSYWDIARSTASASSGESAIGARPRSSSFT